MQRYGVQFESPQQQNPCHQVQKIQARTGGVRGQQSQITTTATNTRILTEVGENSDLELTSQITINSDSIGTVGVEGAVSSRVEQMPGVDKTKSEQRCEGEGVEDKGREAEIEGGE